LQTGLTATKETAERVRTRIEAESWPCRAVTANIGIAYGGGGLVDAGKLIRQADRARYFSKQHGRNREPKDRMIESFQGFFNHGRKIGDYPGRQNQ